jgi:2-dehydropantoate 2-reductase
MKILIVGAGGIGGFFGARLIQVGADVTYLLRDKRKALIDEQGLSIHTPTESFTVRPATVSSSPWA